MNSATTTLGSHSTVAGQGPTPGFWGLNAVGGQQGAVRGPGGRIWLIG